MSRASELLQALEADGVQARWTPSGPVLGGNLSALREEQKTALRAVSKEFRALVAWRHLQAASERSFGHSGARLYPFTRLRPLQDSGAPAVRTPDGEARLVSVEGESGLCVLVSDIQMGQPQGRRYHHSIITPPAEPPPPWQLANQTYQRKEAK